MKRQPGLLREYGSHRNLLNIRSKNKGSFVCSRSPLGAAHQQSVNRPESAYGEGQGIDLFEVPKFREIEPYGRRLGPCVVMDSCQQPTCAATHRRVDLSL